MQREGLVPESPILLRPVLITTPTAPSPSAAQTRHSAQAPVCLFLSARIVGFYASLFGNKTKFFFLWEDIEDIQVLPPTLASMGSPTVVMTLRPNRGTDARIGAKTHDEEGRLKFHFHSFVSFNVAQKTIMALWKAKSLTPEQKVQAVEEESEQKLQSEESGSFLGIDDV
uniref:GRAM domain-containing protein n=1 Tax=Brassica oleracea var. oleracea TaxID=109376 RepID=A0A0D3AEI4_BRAOL